MTGIAVGKGMSFAGRVFGVAGFNGIEETLAAPSI